MDEKVSAHLETVLSLPPVMAHLEGLAGQDQLKLFFGCYSIPSACEQSCDLVIYNNQSR